MLSVTCANHCGHYSHTQGPKPEFPSQQLESANLICVTMIFFLIVSGKMNKTLKSI